MIRVFMNKNRVKHDRFYLKITILFYLRDVKIQSRKIPNNILDTYTLYDFSSILSPSTYYFFQFWRSVIKDISFVFEVSNTYILLIDMQRHNTVLFLL